MIQPEIPARQIHLRPLPRNVFPCQRGGIRQHLLGASQKLAHPSFFLPHAQCSTLDHGEDPRIHVHPSSPPDLPPNPLKGRYRGQGVMVEIPRMYRRLWPDEGRTAVGRFRLVIWEWDERDEVMRRGRGLGAWGESVGVGRIQTLKRVEVGEDAGLVLDVVVTILSIGKVRIGKVRSGVSTSSSSANWPLIGLQTMPNLTRKR